MFAKILYPTDFSDVARKALNYVSCLKSTGAAEVVIIHVIDSRSFDVIASHRPLDVARFQKAWEEKAAEEMKGIEKELKEKGYRVKSRIETGIPFREILRVSEEENVSVIVVGSHGKSNLADIFLGSVSEKIIQNSKKPVLVVTR
jgi:nucleotide-binding universal stress UspA family protein